MFLLSRRPAERRTASAEDIGRPGPAEIAIVPGQKQIEKVAHPYATALASRRTHTRWRLAF